MLRHNGCDSMTNPPKDIRYAVGEAPDGRKHLVINLSGEFPTSEDVAAFLRESGEYLIEQADLFGDSSDDGD